MKILDFLNKKNLTIPNALSLFRICLIPIILFLFIKDNYWSTPVAIVLTVLAALTDILDGYLARKLNQVTELGKILDPLADKIAAAAIFIYLYLFKDFPFWLISMILLRDLLLIIGALFLINKKDVVIPSNQIGKWTAGILFLLFLVYIFNLDNFKQPLEIICGLMIVVSFTSYIISVIRIEKNND